MNLNPRFTNRAPEVEPFAFAGVELLPERTGTRAADATPEKARAPARPRGGQEGAGNTFARSSNGLLTEALFCGIFVIAPQDALHQTRTRLRARAVRGRQGRVE